MKTAISIPDDTYRRVEGKVQELGISRSQFYAVAAERYLESLEAETLAGAVSAAVDIIGATDPSNQAAVSASSSVLAGSSSVLAGESW